jgi:hypothetical protein
VSALATGLSREIDGIPAVAAFFTAVVNALEDSGSYTISASLRSTIWLKSATWSVTSSEEVTASTLYPAPLSMPSRMACRASW